jgi:D-amino-acid dehydrogenase
MQVAVIGGGVIGVCTAYYLAEAGHEVVVVERHNNVAEQASFGNAGIVAPAYAMPWASPGMPRKILSKLLASDSPVLLRPTMNRALWRWIKMWMSECEFDRYRINRERMQRVARYSSDLLVDLRETYDLQYEQSQGYLQLFRTERDMKLAEPALALLAEEGIAPSMLDADGARAVEPALAATAALAGALHLPHDGAGNCPLFTKQMRYVAQTLGVEFHFNTTLRALRREEGRVALDIDDRSFHADAVVLATGVDSAHLLESLGVRIPLYPVKGYSATASIKNFDEAPLATLMDESLRIAITRLGSRVRIAGIAELGAQDGAMRDAALRTLIKVGDDWFPHAANYHSAQFWCGTQPMLPDGAPLLGATPVKNVFINIGHGSTGWAMAAGSGKIVADLVSGHQADIDMDGLTLSRYG